MGASQSDILLAIFSAVLGFGLSELRRWFWPPKIHSVLEQQNDQMDILLRATKISENLTADVLMKNFENFNEKQEAVWKAKMQEDLPYWFGGIAIFAWIYIVLPIIIVQENQVFKFREMNWLELIGAAAGTIFVVWFLWLMTKLRTEHKTYFERIVSELDDLREKLFLPPSDKSRYENNE